MMTKEGCTKIYTFHDPWIGVRVMRCGHISYIVKTHYFFFKTTFFSTLRHKTEGIVMMSKEGSTKIVNFMTPGTGVLVLGRGHISHILKMHYFFKNLLLFTQA